MIDTLLYGGGLLAGGSAMFQSFAPSIERPVNPFVRYAATAAGALFTGAGVSGAASGVYNAATDPYSSTPSRVFHSAITGGMAGATLGAGSALFPVAAKVIAPGGADAVRVSYQKGVSTAETLMTGRRGVRGAYAMPAEEVLEATIGGRTGSIVSRIPGARRYAAQVSGVKNVITEHFGEEAAALGKRLKWGGVIGTSVGLGMALLGGMAASSSGSSLQSNRPIY